MSKSAILGIAGALLLGLSTHGAQASVAGTIDIDSWQFETPLIDPITDGVVAVGNWDNGAVEAWSDGDMIAQVSGSFFDAIPTYNLKAHLGDRDGKNGGQETLSLFAGGDPAKIGKKATVVDAPIPAAAWLFGSALVGFVLVGSRRRV